VVRPVRSLDRRITAQSTLRWRRNWPEPTDHGKCGWKWSVATDRAGIPVGWETAGANRNDCVLLEPTVDAIDGRGLLADIDTMHLDRGYDNSIVRALFEPSRRTVRLRADLLDTSSARSA